MSGKLEWKRLFKQVEVTAEVTIIITTMVPAIITMIVTTTIEGSPVAQQIEEHRSLRKESKLCNSKMPSFLYLFWFALLSLLFPWPPLPLQLSPHWSSMIELACSPTFVFQPKVSIKTFNKQFHQFYLSFWFNWYRLGIRTGGARKQADEHFCRCSRDQKDSQCISSFRDPTVYTL